MVTELLSHTLFDALQAVKKESFFNEEPVKRKDAIEKQLSKAYPKSLITYLSTCSKTDFARDCQELTPFIGAKESLFAQPLNAKENGLYLAFLQFLEKDLLRELKETAASPSSLLQRLRELQKAEKEGEREIRILVREAQELLAIALNKESAVIQIATPLGEIDLAAFEKLTRSSIKEGIPSITVNKALLGGSRVFEGGKLTDHSWHAKLTVLFSRLK